MLDNYSEKLPVVYKLLKKEIERDSLSHAYIFEVNENNNAFDIVLAFSEAILCPKNYTNHSECGECYQCKKIENNIFSELKIINPNNQIIKKEQIDELRIEFKKKGIESKKRVYIINQAEKMNLQASNSMLKFLEEPEADIIAILITNNTNQLLDTIVSRCQVISLSKRFNDKRDSFTFLIPVSFKEKSEKEISQFIVKILEFINQLEKDWSSAFLHVNEKWYKFVNTKEELEFAFDIIEILYHDCILFKCNCSDVIFSDFNESIEKISVLNDFDILIKKLEIVQNVKKNFKYNLNIQLLMDKFMIDMRRLN